MTRTAVLPLPLIAYQRDDIWYSVRNHGLQMIRAGRETPDIVRLTGLSGRSIGRIRACEKRGDYADLDV